MKTPFAVALAAVTFLPATLAQSPKIQSPNIQPPDQTTQGQLDVTPTTRPLTPIHTQADDMGIPYGIWAAGDGYKASFHDGMRFVPYLGHDYPIAQSIGWQTQSARVGELELVTQSPTRQTEQFRTEFDLGGVIEAYDVRHDGLEQTFVLSQHPGVSGDLVIRGVVDTLMSTELREAKHAALTFVDSEGRSLVTYGAATAVDAKGARCPMTTAVTEDGIELRLAGSWMDRAVFPIVVDPLFAPDGVAVGSVLYETELYYDGSVGSYQVWLAEVRYASSADSDMNLIRCDNNGSLPIVVYADGSSNWSVTGPSIGMNESAQRTLTVSTRDFHATNVRRIRGHIHARTDFTLLPETLLINNPDERNRWRPAVSNELSPVSFSTLMVVCQVESTGAFSTTNSSDIYGAVIALGGTGTIIDQFPIASAVAVDYERPSIAQCSVGPTREWNVAFQQFRNFWPGNALDWDVAVARVLDDGTVVTTSLFGATVDNQHQMAPLISGVDDRLTLFYTESSIAESSARPTGPNGHRIRSVRINYTPGGYVRPYSFRVLQSNNDARLFLTGADYDLSTQSHWAYAFRSNTTDRLYLRTIGHNGSPVSSDFVDEPSINIGNTVGGQVAYRSSFGGFVVGYGVNEPGIANELRIARRPWDDPSPISDGVGCSPATIAWYGGTIAGSELCGVQMDNVPANSFAAVAVTTAPAQLQLFGFNGVHDGCWLYVPLSGPNYLGLLGPQIGSSPSFPLNLPANLPQTALHFQGIVYDGNSGEFWSTDRLTVNTGN